jgi:recombination protein RecT
VKEIVSDVVREGDVFEYARELDRDTLRHRPNEDTDPPGELTHAYAIVRFTNGGAEWVVLNRRQVEKRRASSDSYKGGSEYSPWRKYEEEMWRKSALRALATRTGLLEAEAAQAVAFEETTLRVDEGAIVPAEHRVDDDDMLAIDTGETDE